MGILSDLFHKVFPASHPANQSDPATAQPQAAPGNAASVASEASRPPVDIDAVLTQMQRTNPQKLNWKTSIVDLMKLVGARQQPRQSQAARAGTALRRRHQRLRVDDRLAVSPGHAEDGRERGQAASRPAVALRDRAVASRAVASRATAATRACRRLRWAIGLVVRAQWLVVSSTGCVHWPPHPWKPPSRRSKRSAGCWATPSSTSPWLRCVRNSRRWTRPRRRNRPSRHRQRSQNRRCAWSASSSSMSWGRPR